MKLIAAASIASVMKAYFSCSDLAHDLLTAWSRLS